MRSTIQWAIEVGIGVGIAFIVIIATIGILLVIFSCEEPEPACKFKDTRCIEKVIEYCTETHEWIPFMDCGEYPDQQCCELTDAGHAWCLEECQND